MSEFIVPQWFVWVTLFMIGLTVLTFALDANSRAAAQERQAEAEWLRLMDQVTEAHRDFRT